MSGRAPKVLLQLIVLLIVNDLDGLARPHLAEISQSIQLVPKNHMDNQTLDLNSIAMTFMNLKSVHRELFDETTNKHNNRPRRLADVIFPDDDGYDVDYDDYQSGNVIDAQPPPSHIQPQCASNGRTYCENVDGYPAQYVNSLMNTSENKNLLNNNGVVTAYGLAQRMDTSMEEISFCGTRKVVIYPKLALSVNNNWCYIINQAQYMQGVRVELCAHSNACGFSEMLPNGYVSQCVQKFEERMLVGLDSDGHAVKNYFRLPSHCECILKRMRRY